MKNKGSVAGGVRCVGRYVPTERVRAVSTYRPSGYVRKKAGDTHHSTAHHSTPQHTTPQHSAEHSTAHYTPEGTADSGTHGAHAGDVGQAQEGTARLTEWKEQVEGATGHRPNATTN